MLGKQKFYWYRAKEFFWKLSVNNKKNRQKTNAQLPEFLLKKYITNQIIHSDTLEKTTIIHAAVDTVGFIQKSKNVHVIVVFLRIISYKQ